MFFLDIILYKLACLIWPDEEQTQPQQQRSRDSEDCGNWVILDHMDRNAMHEGFNDNDPFLNEEYDDGPDW